MKRNYHIDKDWKSGVNPEAGKDFNAALGTYRKAVMRRNIMKGGLFATGIAALVVLVLILLPGDSDPLQAETPLQLEPEMAVVKESPSPFETPYESYDINPSEDNILLTTDGVVIDIPASSLDCSDSIVTIEYKPLNHPWAVSNEGISMAYDSGGTRHDFESAGMFEILAKNAGESVDLRDNSALKVFYPQTKGSSFNTYTYGRETAQWKFVEKPAVIPQKEVCEEVGLVMGGVSEQEDSLRFEYSVYYKRRSLSGSAPKPPAKANKDNYRFTLDIEPGEFPQLEEFKSVEFEVIDPRFSHSFFEETWDDIKVTWRGNDQYLITLKEGKRKEEFKVYPVLEGEEFEAKYRKYEEKLESFEANNKNIEEGLARLEEELAKCVAASERIVARDSQTNIIRNALSEFQLSNSYYQINLPSLGICNLDAPITLPKGQPIMADFYVTKGEDKIRLHHVTLVDLDKRRYYEFPRARMKEFRYQKSRTNMIIALTDDGEMAIARPEQFDVIDTKLGMHDFHLEWVPVYPSNEEILAIMDSVSEPS